MVFALPLQQLWTSGRNLLGAGRDDTGDVGRLLPFRPAIHASCAGVAAQPTFTLNAPTPAASAVLFRLDGSDDGQQRMFPLDLLEHVPSALVRLPQVQDQEIYWLLFDPLQGFLTVRREHSLVACLAQQFA